ncbi:hypothetical protein HK100_005909, partial [Physocladia obscura]
MQKYQLVTKTKNDIFYVTLKCIKTFGFELPRGITYQELNNLMESFVGGLIDDGSDSIVIASTVCRVPIG